VIRAPEQFETGFARIRDELGVPETFPAEVLDEARASMPAATGGATDRIDARQLDLVAIDPPGSTDLDQAFAAERNGDGFRVHYAIADVAAFVAPGGAVDLEARRRGLTLYSPDGRAPLHPPVLSEGRASLLPGGERPALLWTVDLDGDGRPTDWRLERATVTVREAISYEEAQARLDGKRPPVAGRVDIELLRQIGMLREQREADRGGVSLALPGQEIVERDGTYELELDRSLPVEGGNAQISLLTGMVAARTMVDAQVGILRTLPPAPPAAVARLRLTASALGLDWPAEQPYAAFVRSLTADTPAASAFLVQATRVLRGAGYLGFDGALPGGAAHSAIASVYAHVTAPLRRLVDRFANEILLATYAGRRPPAWATEALDELPSLMGRAQQRSAALERAMIDFAEAVTLEASVGHRSRGVVIDVDADRERARVQIADPAIVAAIDGPALVLGQEVDLVLTAVSVQERAVSFQVAPSAV
jgi:exoribonuclease R